MDLHTRIDDTASNEQINVLLIEDSSGDAALISAYLQRSQPSIFNLAIADRVSSGKSLLARGGMDIVLLDLSLPDSQGLDSLSDLLAIAPTVPLIVLTGLDDDQLGLEAVTRGAQDYLVKGTINGESLRRSLRYAIERKRTEDTLRRVNRAYRVLAGGNHAVVHSSDEHALMAEICRVATQIGGYKLAWVGYARQDAAHTVEPIAWAGEGAAYIAQLKVTWGDDSPHGRGPFGTAIRTRRPVACKNTLADPAFQPWRKQARKYGFNSLLAFPLSDGEQTFGALTVYAGEPDAFDVQEIALLEELSGEVAQRVTALRERIVRQRAEQALRESEGRFRRLIEHSPDIIFRYRIAPQPGLEYLSPTANKILGYPSEDAYDLLDTRLRALCTSVSLSNSPQILEIADSAGQPVWLELRLAPVHDEGQALVAVEGIAQDITERKLAEDAEREQRALAEALTNTAAALSSTLDLDEVMNRILDYVGRVVPHDAANIMLIEGGEVRIAYWRGYPESYREVFHTLRFPIDLARFQAMITTRHPILITDTTEDPLWMRIPETSYIRSYTAVPILTQDRVIGFLSLDSRTPDFFTPVHAERLQAFANQVGIASENAQLYDQIRRYSVELEQRVAQRTLDLSVRNAAIEKLSHTLDVNRMLDGVLRLITDMMPVSGAALYLVNEERTSLDLVVHTGMPLDELNAAAGVPTGPGYDAWFNELRLAKKTSDPQAVFRFGADHALNVPFWQQNQVQGVLSLIHDDGGLWQEGELSMFDAIARQICIAVSNARSYMAAVRGEAQIRAILHNVADGLLVFDHSGGLLLMNPAAEALFGFYPSALGGAKRVSDILWSWLQTHLENGHLPLSVEFVMPANGIDAEEESAVEQWCEIDGCPSQSDDKTMPCWLFVQNETFGSIAQTCPIYRRVPRRAVNARVAEVRDTADQFLGTVIGLHDVTYYRDLDDLKNQFVSTVSHEMRTPLSTVVLQIGTVLAYYDRLTETERREMLHEIQEQAHVLRDLIEDILGVSRLDARREYPEKQRFDLAARCRALVSVMRTQIQQKNLRIDLDGCSDSLEITADIDQIERVFRNLTSNAIKYTPAGGEIRVRLTQSHGEAHLSVIDSGIGIPPEDQLYVFDRFYRADQAALIAHGTGLGLSICKELVELHGGRIDVHSEPGKGSTFTVHLPLG
ncbi:GAF domain-containing protein [Aggregatilinea lenta]|uniref:GAF domain-containing protein n=1 Tax=Aggregatilinea lenta TaxID=913108 RepID=UPI0013C2D196|nr:GAF domain-containing protein [Aggregatilinea lenta]